MLLGNGDGTFQTPVQYAVGSAPISIVAGDFNGDGRTDLAVANLRQRRVGVAGQRRRHLPGTRRRTRWETGQRARGGATSTATAGTDLAVANFNDNDVSVLLGNGDGTFQDPVHVRGGYGPNAIVAGDFTGDGRTDLAVANLTTTTCRCCWATATAPSRTRCDTRRGTGHTPIVAGDFNRRRPHRPGRRQRWLQRRVGVAGQRRRHLPEPGEVRGGVDGPESLVAGTSTATAGSTWPSPTTAPTTCRCC